MFSEDGQYLRHFGEKGWRRLNGPKGLCVSGDYVYVTEWYVSVFRTSGEFVCSFGKSAKLCGIAVDQDGFVFVCMEGSIDNLTQIMIVAIIYKCTSYLLLATGV